MKYECVCGYVYDEVAGDSDIDVLPGTKWDELTDSFACPVCGAGKDGFTAM
ncbi:MAG: rubredoxin [Lachnospiraceae bacterium]|jgi:rubredoxin|nr:rubredoxin [Lachnospiraceae bacterium]